MATNFPTSVDAFNNPQSSDNLNTTGVTHNVQHSDANDAIEAIETYLLAYLRRGAGSPEGVVTAVIGSLYLRTDGGTSTTLYVKTSGTGNTGWTAK